MADKRRHPNPDERAQHRANPSEQGRRGKLAWQMKAKYRHKSALADFCAKGNLVP